MKKQILIIAAILLLVNSFLWIGLTVEQYQETILTWLKMESFFGFAFMMILVSNSFVVGFSALAIYSLNEKLEKERDFQNNLQNT